MATKRKNSLLATPVILLVSLQAVGCARGPYYSLEGDGQARKVVVTREDGEKITVDLGLSSVDGVWRFVNTNRKQAKEMLEQHHKIGFTAETDLGVRVVGTVIKNGVTVSEVYLDGKRLENW